MEESRIFRAARKLPPSEQGTYLNLACGDNKELQSDIEDLLAINHRYEGSTAVHQLDSETLVHIPASMNVGRYQLRNVIGEGGMGVVYLADQQEPVQRQVAIKLMRGYGASTSQAARFEQECQMLAVLDHPNIAKVLDAGTSTFGSSSTPALYLVMEYLKGKPIKQYCDDNQLTIRERIELMVPVCQAIQHAHQKGVIHRDLKPSNILVCQFDGKAIPKVIDFGVAKWQESKSTSEPQLTEVGALIGTLDYIAPEQAELKHCDIDTRSDIYSLGVVLYELLVGVRPHDRLELQRFSYPELLDYFKNKEIVKPSCKLLAQTSQSHASGDSLANRSRLKHALQGDLDWIVMKCLEKDRNHRYETATELGMDLSRYLNDEPVHAGPPCWRYKLQKFHRKHRSKVMAASFLVLALLAGIFTSAIGWKRALDAEKLAEDRAEQVANALRKEESLRVEVEKQRDRAQGEKQIADAVTRFLQTKLLAQGDYRFQVNSLLKLYGGFDSAEHDPHISKLLEHAEQELTTERINKNFPEQHAVQAKLLQTVGDTYMNVGKPLAAVNLLERGLKIYQDHLPDQQVESLRLMNNLGIAYIESGRFRQAVQMLSEVQQQKTLRFGKKHPETIITMHNLAQAYYLMTDYRRAHDLHQECIQLHEGVYNTDHPIALLNKNNLGLVLAHLGKTTKAIQCLESVRQIQTARQGADHPDTLVTMHNLGLAYQLAGRARESMALFDEVYIKRKEKLGKNHRRTLSSATQLGLAYHDCGRLVEASHLLEQCYRERLATLPADHYDVLTVMNQLGMAYQSLGKKSEAFKLFHDSYITACKTLGPDHSLALSAHNNIGSAYFSSGRYQEAVQVFEDVVSRREAKLGRDHHSTLTSLNNLATSNANLNKIDKAILLLKEVIELRAKSLGVDHPQTLASQFNLAVVQSKDGNVNDALKLMEEVYTVRVRKLGQNHSETIFNLEQLGILYQRAKNHDLAHTRYEQALNLYLAQTPPDEKMITTTRANLGLNLKEARRFSEAIPVLERACEHSQKYPLLGFAKVALLDCYLELKDDAKVEKTVRQMLAHAKTKHSQDPSKLNKELTALTKQLNEAKRTELAALVRRELMPSPVNAGK